MVYIDFTQKEKEEKRRNNHGGKEREKKIHKAKHNLFAKGIFIKIKHRSTKAL